MPAVTGMVMEVGEHNCVILTPDGDFRKVPLPPGKIHLGQEITCPLPEYHFWRQSLLIAASVLILIGGFLFYQGQVNRAVAYISMDINPSVELALDSRQNVCQARGLNADGDALLSQASVVGSPLATAVSGLLEAAVEGHYLQPGGQNVILATVTAVNSQPVLEPQVLQQYIDRPLDASRIKAEVVVDRAAAQIRTQAMQAGLSTGRYLLQMRLARQGINIGRDELKHEGMASLEKEKNFHLADVFASESHSPTVSPGEVRITPLPPPENRQAASPPAAKPKEGHNGNASASGQKKAVISKPGTAAAVRPAEHDHWKETSVKLDEHHKPKEEKFFWRQNRDEGKEAGIGRRDEE